MREYFGDRHWDGGSLEECVLDGMRIAAETKKQFLWLTCTNKGSSEVCEAALRVQGITEEQLKAGYPCDPTSKSKLRIIAKPGILIRLTRNFDKSRGFVNGAIAKVFEDLGEGVFVAQLLETGNLVLVHPMKENDYEFLPCCYGYATTIRRAQGASLDQGCIYFEQMKYPAGRGYAYVAVSRFRTRAGCHLYGKLRRSDFLPVGEDKESEQLDRGYYSLNSSDSEYDGAENYGHGMYGENDSSSEEYNADEAKIGSGMFNENASSDEDGDRVLKPANALIADPDFDFSV